MIARPSSRSILSAYILSFSHANFHPLALNYFKGNNTTVGTAPSFDYYNIIRADLLYSW